MKKCIYCNYEGSMIKEQCSEKGMIVDKITCPNCGSFQESEGVYQNNE